MSSFLQEFDEAIDAARQTGQPEWVWRSWFDEDGAYNLRPVARTMHPAFMGKPVPKHDPERDQ